LRCHDRILLDAVRWHDCHNDYHLGAGMATFVDYTG
jgi:hypothetical protein